MRRERQKQALARVRFAKRTVWSLAEAREALERLVGTTRRLGAGSTSILIAYVVEPSMRATVLASSLAATLELVREGADRGASARAHSRRSICASAARSAADGAAAAAGEPTATITTMKLGGALMASLAEKRVIDDVEDDSKDAGDGRRAERGRRNCG